MNKPDEAAVTAAIMKWEAAVYGERNDEIDDSDLDAVRAELLDVLRPLMAIAQRPVPAPVHGDVLPPIGSDVLIRHGRDDDDHLCTVTGYYAWPDLKGDKHLHRVFVQVVYKGTDTPNARLLGMDSIITQS